MVWMRESSVELHGGSDCTEHDRKAVFDRPYVAPHDNDAALLLRVLLGILGMYSLLINFAKNAPHPGTLFSLALSRLKSP